MCMHELSSKEAVGNYHGYNMAWSCNGHRCWTLSACCYCSACFGCCELNPSYVADLWWVGCCIPRTACGCLSAILCGIPSDLWSLTWNCGYAACCYPCRRAWFGCDDPSPLWESPSGLSFRAGPYNETVRIHRCSQCLYYTCCAYTTDDAEYHHSNVIVERCGWFKPRLVAPLPPIAMREGGDTGPVPPTVSASNN